MERFWSKVAKGEGCWEWTGARFVNEQGQRSYGMFSVARKPVYAHRTAWELTHGPIPAGRLVLHHCDNRACVRPDHLYLGSHADNMRDSVARRRTPDGERVGSHKLNEASVRAIRARAGEPTEALGREFGVSGRTVRYLLRGERWRHV